MTLGSLDLSLYTHGDAGQRHEFASQLLGRLTDHGFVKLVKHGISDQRIRELSKWVSVWLLWCQTCRDHSHRIDNQA